MENHIYPVEVGCRCFFGTAANQRKALKDLAEEAEASG